MISIGLQTLRKKSWIKCIRESHGPKKGAHRHFLSSQRQPTLRESKLFELNVYPKISKNLGMATHTEQFKTREEAEARRREIEAQDAEHRLEIEITEIVPED